MNSQLVCKFVLLSICIYHASGEISIENTEKSISKKGTFKDNLELPTIPQSVT